MKIPFSTVLFSFLTVHALCQSPKTKIADQDFNSAVKDWFSAWELVSKEIYHIDSLRAVDFIFFDEEYIYSTSSVTIPAGQAIKGPSIMNKTLKWKRALLTDSIMLPNKTVVPVGLMSFASEYDGQKARSFFIMPLPAFWKKAGVTSKELGLMNLITGVFVHEFSHSQQMQNFGRKMTEFENKYDFGIEFSDDLVQNLFSKDSAYLSVYYPEVDLFYKVVSEKDEKKIESLSDAINVLRQRQKRFFIGQNEILKEIDDFFLTMEGLGQYSMYRWLIHPKGGNIPEALVIEGVRRNKHWWSQDEGFALFLNLASLSDPKNWAGDMFGDKTESIVELIDRLIN